MKTNHFFILKDILVNVIVIPIQISKDIIHKHYLRKRTAKQRWFLLIMMSYVFIMKQVKPNP